LKKKVAVLGATGLIGQTIIKMLEDHPWFSIEALVASKNSAGGKYSDKCRWILSDPMPESVKDMEIVDVDSALDTPILFSALDSSVADEIEITYRQKGHNIVSNSSNHRMDNDVPLIIPEVNPDHLKLITVNSDRGWEVTNPNCSAVVIALALAPISAEFGLEQVFVVTMQSSSGAGYPGVSFLDLSDNILPFITGEEPKIEKEITKIFGSVNGEQIVDYECEVSVQTNRVPVTYGHMVSMFITTNKTPDVERINDLLKNFSGIPQERDLPLAPKHPIHLGENRFRPQPRLDVNQENGMAITVGRVEKVSENAFRMVALGHNTVRGGAGSAILNAELLHSEGMI